MQRLSNSILRTYKPEDRGRRTEDRGLMTVDRDQKPEDRGQAIEEFERRKLAHITQQIVLHPI